MAILIGMDEAGYGPNLGPLVVAATAWEVAENGVRDGDSPVTKCGIPGSLESPQLGRGASSARSDSSTSLEVAAGSTGASRAGLLVDGDGADDVAAVATRQSGGLPDLCEVDLYRLLRPTVARVAHEKRIAIADSKVLYRPGLGLRQLERGVHAVLGAMERSASSWSDVVELWRADPSEHHRSLCWHDGFDCALPVDATAAELARLAERFAKACAKAGVQPVGVFARLVYPGEFNELVHYHGTKGAALSHVTVGLLREAVDFAQGMRDGNGIGNNRQNETRAPDPDANGAGLNTASFTKGTGTDRRNVMAAPGGRAVGTRPLFAVCDKHGGRNFYAALLQHHFSEHWIEPVFEGAEESRYEWGPREARTCVAFRTRGEAFLPTALASMTAKYLRELAMRAFNEFWCGRVPGLKPTAGYPIDARRFKQAIAAKQRELGIEDHVLWRVR